MSLLLVIDVGNTNTKVGVCDTMRVLASWALTTRRDQTADEYGLMIERLLASRGITPDAIAAIAISNVVPPVQRALDDMAPRFFGVRAISVEPGPDAPIALDVDDPHAVGADRIVAALAAQVRYGTPVIVVDLGTATRFDCVNRAGAFVGGAIAPGIGIAFDALVQRAARLSRVPLDRPARAIGRDTATSLQSGVVYGYAGLVDGVVERMKRELDGAPVVVATGGLAPLLEGVARSIDHVDADLKLDGLRLAHARTATIEPRIR